MRSWCYLWAVLGVCVWAVGVKAASLKAHPRQDPGKGEELDRPGRIVGGQIAKSGQFQWQVSLQKRSIYYNGHQHSCGGTLISENLVLTAAHCLSRVSSPSSFVVVSGILNLKDSKQEVHKVLNYAFMNSFDSSNLRNDIGLVQIEKKNIGGLRRHVSIETEKDSLAGQTALVSGWGTLQYYGTRPDQLYYTKVVLKSDAECRNMFSKEKVEGANIFDSMLCAGGGPRDACQGDSGGPLVLCKDNSARDPSDCRVVGVVSWGIGCATEGFPGVYSECAHFIKWIKETVKKFGFDVERELSFRSMDNVAEVKEHDEHEEEHEEKKIVKKHKGKHSN